MTRILVPWVNHQEKLRRKAAGLPEIENIYAPLDPSFFASVSSSTLTKGSSFGMSSSSSIASTASEESAASLTISYFHDVDLRTLNLDAGKWKHQDHYAVLGLGKIRHAATTDQIRSAYRRRILQYHPDKKSQTSLNDLASSSPLNADAEGEESEADRIFKCVQRAWEVLSDPVKRQQWDSVDFDESIPAPGLSVPEDKFFGVYGPIFARNARFSVKQPVPEIGDPKTPISAVNTFYDFWRKFDSWRRFEWEDPDEDDQGKPAPSPDDPGANRADKRWADKGRRAARAKRKAEDNARIQRLVQQAYCCDPRIQEAKQVAAQAKASKARAAQEAQEAAQRVAQEAQERAQREAQEAQRAAFEASALLKASKEAERAVLRQERRRFRDFWTTCNYHAPAGSQGLSLVAERAGRVESLVTAMGLVQLADLNERLPSMSPEEAISALTSVTITPVQPPLTPANSASSSPNFSSFESVKEVTWSMGDIDALILAVKAVPAGTHDRWPKIAEAVNKTRCLLGTDPFTVEQVIREASKLKSGTEIPPVNQALPEKPASAGKKDPRLAQNTPTQRYDENRPWTPQEQASLEAALKAHSPDMPDRWDRIAEDVPARTKKECMARVRDVALALKAKRTATKK